MATDSSPADAFEALRREVALLRRALEGLAAEQKAQPDYSGVLAGIGARIKEQNTALGVLAEAPALQLTPEAIGQQIMRASEQVRSEDSRLLGQAQNGMTTAVRQIEAALATARTVQAQQRAVRWSAILGIVAGVIIGAASAAITIEGKTLQVAITGEDSAKSPREPHPYHQSQAFQWTRLMGPVSASGNVATSQLLLATSPTTSSCGI